MEQTFLGRTPTRATASADILYHMDVYDNTAHTSGSWRSPAPSSASRGRRLGIADSTWLCNRAEKVMAQRDWEEQVLAKSNIEQVFLTNDFDDPLEGFDTKKYVPCLRTDDLVFHLDKAGSAATAGEGDRD